MGYIFQTNVALLSQAPTLASAVYALAETFQGCIAMIAVMRQSYIITKMQC